LVLKVVSADYGYFGSTYENIEMTELDFIMESKCSRRCSNRILENMRGDKDGLKQTNPSGQKGTKALVNTVLPSRRPSDRKLCR
jgi:hypothetical protein